jgi:aminopeptidase N
VASATAAAPGGAEVALASFAPDEVASNERLVLRLPAALRGQRALTLRFNFSGTLSATVIGFYASSYVNETSGATVPIVQTKFEPSFARTAFPCFDEPAIKATFALALSGVPAGYSALGNTPPLTQLANGAVAFATTPVMSTYQLTAVVAPMVFVAGVLPAKPALNRTVDLNVSCWTMDRGNASSPLATQQRGGLAFALGAAIAGHRCVAW